MRFLIEEATHIATSSVYKDPDPPHWRVPFPWGGYCVHQGYNHDCRYPESDEVVVIKTHFPAIPKKEFDEKPYAVTIRILRHPIECIYSLFEYLYGHRENDFKMPNHFVKEFSRRWKLFQNYWDDQPNVLTIRYEDLFRDPSTYLKLVLNTIGYKVRNKDIQRAIEKYPPTGKLIKHVPHYTEKTYGLLRENLRHEMKQYGYNMPNIFKSKKIKVKKQKKYTEKNYILPMPSSK